MKTLLPLFGLAVAMGLGTSPAQAAAVVTCTQPGYGQTVMNGICHGATGNTLSYGGVTQAFLQNGEFQVNAIAQIYSLPDQTAGPFPITGSASWDDTFYLPSSPSGDILQIFVTGGGLGHTGSIQAGSINYVNFCDAHYTGNPACSDRETTTATSVSFVHVTGSDSITLAGPCAFGCGISVNADLSEFVTVNRFLADGVTPDPFTTLTAAPEPSSLRLLTIALLGLVLCLRHAAGFKRASATTR